MKTKTRSAPAQKIAILVADGFEQVELERPRAALDRAGFETHIVSPNPRTVKGMQHDKPGLARKVDVNLKKARASGYDALLLPGGVMNPDALRREPAAVKLVQQFWRAGKPVAAICHGPQLLIEAKVVRGRRMTSFPSVQTDLRNAGARWVDRQVVVDHGLVTSRRPADIPAFNRAMIALFRGARKKPRSAIKRKAESGLSVRP
jgi:protease I